MRLCNQLFEGDNDGNFALNMFSTPTLSGNASLASYPGTPPHDLLALNGTTYFLTGTLSNTLNGVNPSISATAGTDHLTALRNGQDGRIYALGTVNKQVWVYNGAPVDAVLHAGERIYDYALDATEQPRDRPRRLCLRHRRRLDDSIGNARRHRRERRHTRTGREHRVSEGDLRRTERVPVRPLRRRSARQPRVLLPNLILSVEVTPRVSVIIPFKQAGAYLDECLAHLERQTYRDFDVYLVPDEPFARAGPEHIIASGPVLPNRKRQLAAEASTAEIVAFIDDDAYAAPDWLASAVRHFDDPNVVASGGPAVTPPDDAPRQRASGAVFAAAIVTATTRHRYVAEAQRDVDALASCNLLVRRDAFLRDAEASVRYWPGEDILLCMFAARDGARIVYDPAALVFHHLRTVFSAHLLQVWSYGRFRGYILRRLTN